MNVQYVKGVGPKRASRLKKLNINTLEDLMYYIPREYEDRSRFINLREAPIGEKSSLKVRIVGPARIIRPRKNLSILKIPFQDESGHGFLVWFNQDYLKDRFKLGESYEVNGKINRVGTEYQIINPVFQREDLGNKVGRIIPLYSLTSGISNNEITKIVSNCLEEYLDFVPEILTDVTRKRYGLMDIKHAIRNIHFPQDAVSLKEARRRLIFQELLLLQLGLFIIKNKNMEDEMGIKFPKVNEMEKFIENLPFELTSAQYRVFQEIDEDMSGLKQMNRLVQGDVGSGKTVVAALAMFRAVKAGYQTTLMAPTEILAIQHFESLTELFKDYGIKCELLTGSLADKEKQVVLKELREGKIDVLIGTHAIIQENVEFQNLALVITDEQHRFGVRQRAILNQKGKKPDVLVMSATPIPRTLALILYGDLDISIIDELPPGRREIETYAVGPEYIPRINKFIEKQILEGRQAYIVCPLIEESEKLDLSSAEEIYEEFKNNTFKNYGVGLLHGKMSNREKDNIMNEFKEGQIDILVSTTVIEVGVNVPNSNIMVIYNAERFGLAQLHQLRGRVGRGKYQSYCILINNSKTKISRERMRILQNSSDGFIISEKDLELRGPGEFFGTRQHGVPELKIANLFRDMDILKLAQRESIDIINSDPNLNSLYNKGVREKVLNMFEAIGEDLILN